MTLSEATSHRFGRFVTPLYRRGVADSVLCEGSGVLVREPNAVWLFTAEHLFNNTQELILYGSRGPIFFPRTVFRGSTRLDLLFARIATDMIEGIQGGGFTFFPSERVEGHERPPPPDECLFVGYPDRSVQVFPEIRRIEAKTTSLRSYFLPQPEYRNFALNKRHHVASRFAGFAEEGTEIPLPDFDPKGLSGGAILRGIPNKGLTLVGIATEYHADKKVLVGSRFNELFPELRRQVRDHGRNLPLI